MENLATQLADLFSAIQCSDEKHIRQLLAANVSPYQQNTAGTNAFMVAAQTGNATVIKMLSRAAKGMPKPAPLFFSPIVLANEESVAISAFLALPPLSSEPLPVSDRSTEILIELSSTDNTDAFSTDAFSTGTGLSTTTVIQSTAIPEAIQRRMPVSPKQAFLSHPETTQTVVHPAIETEPTATPKGPSTLATHTEPPTTQEQSKTQPDAVKAPADNRSILKEAVYRSDIDTVKSLLSKGISVQSENWYDTPLIVVAAQSGHNDIVQALIEAGANVNRGYDRLPLNIAAESGHFEVVHTLMASGAYLEGKEENGYTPLMCAAEAGHLLIVKVLVSCGANINVNNYGKTPLMLAASNGHQEVYQFLNPCANSQEMIEPAKDLQQPSVLVSKQTQLEREMSSIFDHSQTAANITH